MNSEYYNTYRINVTANNGVSNALVIGELEMMETVSAPANLQATAGDSLVQLSYDKVINAHIIM